MKTYKTIILSVAFIIVATKSYSQDTILKRKTWNSHSCIFYKKGDTIPFTGYIYQKYFLFGKKQIFQFENGVFSGVGKGFYKDGSIKYITHFKYGDKHGEEIGYFKSGKIQSRMFFVNGIENGEEISYYQNGKIESKSIVENAFLIGESTSYYQTG